MTLGVYKRDFKAKVEVCEAVCSRVRISKLTTGLVCKSNDENDNVLWASSDVDKQAKLKQM